MSMLLRYLQHTPSLSLQSPNTAILSHPLPLLPIPPLPTFKPFPPRPIPQRVPTAPPIINTSTGTLASIPEELSTPSGLKPGIPPPKPLLARNNYMPAHRVPRCRINAPIRVSRAKEEEDKSRDEVARDLITECRKNPGAWISGRGVERSKKARQRMDGREDVLVLLRRERERKRYWLGEVPVHGGRRDIGEGGMNGEEVRKMKYNMGKGEKQWTGKACGECKKEILGIMCYVCDSGTPAIAAFAARAQVAAKEPRSFHFVKKAPGCLACGGAIVEGRCSVCALVAPWAAVQPSLSRGSVNARRAAPNRLKKTCQTRRKAISGQECLDRKGTMPVNREVAVTGELRNWATSTAEGVSNAIETSKGPSEDLSDQQKDETHMPKRSEDTFQLAPGDTDVAAAATHSSCEIETCTVLRCASVRGESRSSDLKRDRNVTRQRFTGLPIKLDGGYFREHLDESAVGEILTALLESQEAAVRAARERFRSNETTAVATPIMISLNRVKSLCRRIARRTTVAMRKSRIDIKADKDVEESKSLDLVILSRELTRELGRQSITPETDPRPCRRQGKDDKVIGFLELL